MNKLLSVVVPAYNEEKTIVQILDKVINLDLPGAFQKEIIVINDCSKDNTHNLVKDFVHKNENVQLLDNEQNLGKTQSVKKGLLSTKGDFVIIQDADLEYEPQDIVKMLDYALENDSDVVYGDRFGGDNELIYRSFYLGNKVVSMVSNMFTYPRTHKYIPDMEVCYKLVRGEVIRNIAPEISATSSFGLEPEITARLARYKKDGKNLKWGVVPIKYVPRTIEEGKKIRYIDGIKAIGEIIKYNVGK